MRRRRRRRRRGGGGGKGTSEEVEDQVNTSKRANVPLFDDVHFGG